MKAAIIVIGGVVALLAASMAPELKRYLQMRSM